MAGDANSTLQAGRDAIQRHAWKAAFDLLGAEDAAKGLSPDDLELLAQAAWWVGRLGVCIAAHGYLARMRAVVAWRRVRSPRGTL